jgi:hypothetical protein
MAFHSPVEASLSSRDFFKPKLRCSILLRLAALPYEMLINQKNSYTWKRV